MSNMIEQPDDKLLCQQETEEAVSRIKHLLLGFSGRMSPEQIRDITVILNTILHQSYSVRYPAAPLE